MTNMKQTFLVTSLFIALLLSAIPGNAEEGWDDDWGEDDSASSPTSKQTWDITSFAELAIGTRIDDQKIIADNNTLKESRWRLEGAAYINNTYLSVKTDLTIDGLDDSSHFELREASIKHSPVDFLDLSIGRQVITWGTGDLVFLNDLFPKDWISFFGGRDQSYLKAPSDAIRLSFFSGTGNIDIVYMPFFNADNYITGSRFSYFSPSTGNITGEPNTIRAEKPKDSIENGEIAIRFYKQVNSYELALYGFQGRYKRPLGATITSGSSITPFFPRLNVLGGSLLGPIGKGLFNIETSYFDSKDDKEGTDPLIPNSQIRFLLGYQRELIKNLSLGTQYYVEHTKDHKELIAHSFTPDFEAKENRELVSLRLTYRALQDNLIISSMLFYSTSDNDSFFMPSVKYRFNDQLSVDAGVNSFNGKKNHTFFGQLEENSNGYIRVRYTY